MTTEALLQRIPLFSDLAAADVRELIRIGRTLAMDANTVVFQEGDVGDTLYVILSGAVLVSRTDESGQDVALATLQSGDFFGELALIDLEPRSARVATVAPCRFFLLDRNEFLNLMSHLPRRLTVFLVGISAKIRQANEKFSALVLQKERLRAHAEIERHRSIAEMVAGVAHELNTPIGIANQAASIFTERLTPKVIAALARDEDTRALFDDLVEAANLIQTSIARADRVISTFKNMSVRQITDTKETVDLRELTEEIVSLYKLKARQSQLQVEITHQLGDTGAEWSGYPGYFSQVLLNLITNVDRYAYPEGRGGKVEILLASDHSAAKASHFTVTVRDFGRGIPPADLPRVFNPFFTMGRTQGGSGLGLAIVHNLVTSALQGTIQITSELGQGTTVVICLPAVVVGGEPHD